MNKAQKEALAQQRLGGLVRRLHFHRRVLAERLDGTRKLFGRRVYAVDIHSHSSHSDGSGTIDDNYACAKNAGLDFMFATDHASIRQKREAAKYPDASWGQEPGAGLHHIGLLCNRRLFKPGKTDIAEDLKRAGELSPFVWIPHPAGWFPGTYYSETQKEALWTLGNAFAMEVVNGACKIAEAYDSFDATAIELWDRLLCDGRKVTALGGSDAHCPDEFGSVWTGVYAPHRAAPSIIKAMQAGLCFASEASLVEFSCNGQPMGATVRVRKGATLDIKCRAVDSMGLASVRVVSQGRVIRERRVHGDPVVELTLSRRAGTRPVYFRMESTAVDNRRAFSTPVYVETERA